jgi:hypothetical protein
LEEATKVVNRIKFEEEKEAKMKWEAMNTK